MLHKTLLTLGIALASCNVFATDYSNYSYTQLKQEHSRLQQATISDLKFFLKLTTNLKEEHSGKNVTPYELFSVIHGPFFYYVNKDFKVVGNNYYHDPRVTNLVNFYKVCVQIWKHTKEIDAACQAVTYLNIFSGANTDVLQTLAVISPAALILDFPEYEVTAQHTLLTQIAKNWSKYNFSFKFHLPTQNELLDNQHFTKGVPSFLNLNLIAPK